LISLRLNAGSVYLEDGSSMPIFQIRAPKKLAVLVSIGTLFFLATFAGSASGQAVAEAAGATSVSSAVAGSAKGATMPKFPGTASAAASSPHLVVSPGPAPEETNRKALEERAGKDAAKLLLRGAPVQAQIWVDGKLVGKTPLLLVLSPGKYQIEMRGSRGQTGKCSVDLLPRETREMTVKLELLYPGRVTASR
jgi:hypothetical protein